MSRGLRHARRHYGITTCFSGTLQWQKDFDRMAHEYCRWFDVASELKNRIQGMYGRCSKRVRANASFVLMPIAGLIKAPLPHRMPESRWTEPTATESRRFECANDGRVCPLVCMYCSMLARGTIYARISTWVRRSDARHQAHFLPVLYDSAQARITMCYVR